MKLLYFYGIIETASHCLRRVLGDQNEVVVNSDYAPSLGANGSQLGCDSFDVRHFLHCVFDVCDTVSRGSNGQRRSLSCDTECCHSRLAQDGWVQMYVLALRVECIQFGNQPIYTAVGIYGADGRDTDFDQTGIGLRPGRTNNGFPRPLLCLPGNFITYSRFR